jgi:pSer/pThr/pTyr-binding forkhead associated (FHA) protein
MWILTSEDDAGKTTFRLADTSVKTIGRSPGAEFQLERPLVSRLHCQLTAAEESVHVKDLDSTNGTFVNGTRIRTAELKDGDTLRVGRVELRLSRAL